MKINYKYILGIQCFANYESGAAILRINEKIMIMSRYQRKG